MLDIKFIRENPKLVKEGVEKKNVRIDIDKILDLDKKWRKGIKEVESLRAAQNKFGKEDIKRGQEIKTKVKKLEPELEKIEKELEVLLALIPNLPLKSAPVGRDERDNVVLREVGKRTELKFSPKDHLELGEALDLIDVKRAAKVAGTRFFYLKKEAVLLEFALVNLAFDLLVKEGFIPILPPIMLKAEAAKGMGYLEQTDKEDAYYLPKDNLYLIGTSEQSIGVMHQDETFTEKELPKRYVGFSTCFRREAGAYGKDTKGILRVHHFDKVEMFSFCHPNNSVKEHQLLLSLEERLMKALKLPYRVMNIATGDLGRPAAAKYDIEAWMPGQNQYRETHSTSNCTNFQSRRLNIRYRGKDNKLEFVHMLNGTAIATGRILIAIFENYQQKDGSIKIPQVLQKYIGLKTIKK